MPLFKYNLPLLCTVIYIRDLAGIKDIKRIGNNK